MKELSIEYQIKRFNNLFISFLNKNEIQCEDTFGKNLILVKANFERNKSLFDIVVKMLIIRGTVGNLEKEELELLNKAYENIGKTIEKINAETIAEINQDN